MTPGWALVAFRPVSEVMLRKPGPFEAGVHGPASYSSSLSYPLPSTLAGALAGIAWRRSGSCDGVEGSSREFDDLRGCLERILGRNPILRPGLLLYNGEFHVYMNRSIMPRLNDVLEALSQLGPRFSALEAAKTLSDRVKSGYTVRRAARIGIALNRESKSVSEGLMYMKETVFYPGGAEIAVLASNVAGDLGGYTRLGGDGGLALVRVERIGAPVTRLLMRGDGEEWALLLASPALLPESPFRDGVVEVTSSSVAEALAESLLEGVGCAGYSRVVLVPKGELSLEVISPGWSTARRAFREPHLLVPPGTVLYMEASSKCTTHIIEQGIGSHSDVGWGTVIASEVSRHK